MHVYLQNCGALGMHRWCAPTVVLGNAFRARKFYSINLQFKILGFVTSCIHQLHALTNLVVLNCLCIAFGAVHQSNEFKCNFSTKDLHIAILSCEYDQTENNEFSTSVRV